MAVRFARSGILELIYYNITIQYEVYSIARRDSDSDIYSNMESVVSPSDTSSQLILSIESMHGSPTPCLVPPHAEYRVAADSEIRRRNGNSGVRDIS